jgi:hypothetical protein
MGELQNTIPDTDRGIVHTSQSKLTDERREY